MTTRASLDAILNLVDYTNHQCSPTAMVAMAVEEFRFEEARSALAQDRTPSPQRDALLMLLSSIDFTSGACDPFAAISTCLPEAVIVQARAALVEEPPKGEDA